MAYLQNIYLALDLSLLYLINFNFFRKKMLSPQNKEAIRKSNNLIK